MYMEGVDAEMSPTVTSASIKYSGSKPCSFEQLCRIYQPPSLLPSPPTSPSLLFLALLGS